MTERPVSWLRRRLQAGGRERGMVEAGIAAAGGLLVVGAVVGNGIAASVMDMSDGQTWLPSDDGSVVQINPATGQAEQRLVVGADGSEMSLVQGDGYLVVTDLDTGQITAIDLAGLSASRPMQGDENTLMLVGGGQMVRVDLEPGTVRAVDPLTLADLGTPYRTTDLADAVIDRDGSVWLVTTDGDLRELDFVAEAGEFSVSLDRPVTGAGPGSRLVPHDAGVSLFGPDGGAVVQIGVGSDLAVGDSALQGTVAAADFAPSDLVPASATDAGLVFLLSERRLLRVDVGSIGCERPLRPAVFADRVYVPCGGQGTVLVLGPDGERAGEDVRVPGGGDGQLVVDDGRLVVHDPADGRIVVVQQDGSTQVSDVGGAGVPTVEPSTPDSPLPPVVLPPPTPPTPPSGGVEQPTTPPPGVDPPELPTGTVDPPELPTGPTPTGGGTPTGGSTSTGGSTPTPTDGSSARPGTAPRDVAATVQGDGSVTVSWRAPEQQPREYVVRSSDGVSVTVRSGERTATLDAVVCGTDVTVTVYAHHRDGTVAGAQDDVRTPACVNPPNPGALAPGSVQVARAGDDVVVGWDAPALEPERYVVEGRGLTQTVTGGTESATFADVACGEPLTFTVTAVHLTGGEAQTSSRAVADVCATDPADLRPTDVRVSTVDDDTVRVTWAAPAQSPSGYTVTGAGATQTAGAGATSVTLGVSCSATSVQVRVTADFPDGGTGSAGSAAFAHTCATTAPPTTTTPATMTAPGNVSATHTGGENVEVSWTASAPAADTYIVRPSSGGEFSTTSAGIALTLPPGDYTFVVIAQRDGYADATSARSGAVTVPVPATAPAAPGNVGGSHAGHDGGGTALVDVTWTAPADGGSAITGYTVTGPGGSSATAAAGATSARLSIPCSGDALCTGGGSAAVSVTATNAVGTGGAGAGSVTVGPNANIPRDGDAVVELQAGTRGPVDQDGNGWSLTYIPPASWASHTGTCTAYWSSDTGGSGSAVIACGQTATLDSGMAINGQQVSGYVVATGAGVNATSADGGGYVQGRNDLGWCESQSPRLCYPPVALEDPDVDVSPAPWAPPEVPNPPVLVAGGLLLVGAGTLRTLRRRDRVATGADGVADATGPTPTDQPLTDQTLQDPTVKDRR